MPLPSPRELAFRLAKGFQNYRAPLWLYAQRALERPIVAVTDRATGLSFRCLAGADAMLGEIFHERLYDVPLAPIRPGDLVLDIGANHGFASCYFAHHGAQVVAYEPSPRIAALLRANLAANRLAERVQVVEAAIGERAGALELFESTSFGGGMSTVLPGYAEVSGAAYGERVTVPAIAVREVFDRLPPGRIRLLKIDCEGAEAAILRALAPADRDRLDAVAVEVHPQAYALPELLEELLAWEAFHLTRPAAPEALNCVLHLVHERVIREWGAGR
jgi:FkbM family methyltransferase